MKSKPGRILISIIWGLALAMLFRRTCAGQRCTVISGPPVQEVSKHNLRLWHRRVLQVQSTSGKMRPGHCQKSFRKPIDYETLLKSRVLAIQRI